MLVEILITPDCPHVEAALAVVDQAARRVNVFPLVRLIEVSTVEHAHEHRFPGSPTI